MSALERRITSIIEETKKTNRHRSLESSTNGQGRLITINGAEYLNFISNDYLGLSSHPTLRSAAVAAVEQHGVGSGASALLSGRSSVHEALERRLALFMRRERALLFSSGYLANLGVASAIINRTDHIFSDELNHASLIDAISLTKASYTRYRHADLEDLEDGLKACENPVRWIITDTLFSMDGDLAPLEQIASLATKYDATLIGDDAHGFGVLAGGRGAAAACKLNQSEFPIQIVTFGKALGTSGAAVVGSASLIDAIIQRGRTFIYDTAPPPMIAAATLAAIELIETDASIHQRLCTNIAKFRELAKNLPLLDSNSPIQPVIIGSDSNALLVAEQLRATGFYVRAIRPPTVPDGTSRLRLCISAAHKTEDIEALVHALVSTFNRL
ncbi:MAG: 8-amino-7-oxononanoate synthase [Gammaproteobacteria bacterium]|jgi:8-amino-7-oxononanoate synthase